MNFAGCLTGFFEDMYLDFLIFFFFTSVILSVSCLKGRGDREKENG